MRNCHCVELRALCNEVPRTPPGPEGSNGIGNASGAADHPKFLAMAGRIANISRGKRKGKVVRVLQKQKNGLSSYSPQVAPPNIS